MISMAMFTKLWGLKKLRKITRGSRNFGTAPYKAYTDPNQFHIEDALGHPRLLVRTDEKGRRYQRLEWRDMPREDVHIHNTFGRRSANESHVRKGLAKMARRPGINIIVHPTRPREEIAYTGSFFFQKSGEGKAGIRIYIKRNPRAEETRHNIITEPLISIEDIFEKPPKNPDSRGKNTDLKRIVNNAIEFARRALGTRQIRLSSERHIEAHFLTFKRRPTFLEFYDLRELRMKYP